jgi:hypothetical protein
MSMTVLAIGIYWLLTHEPGATLPWYGNKDIAILFTLFFWIFVYLMTSFVRGETYHQIYGSYLKGVPVIGDVTLPTLHLPENGLILDAGSADGRRLCELLRWLGLAHVPLHVVGLDRDEKHAEPFEDHLSKFLAQGSTVSFTTDFAGNKDIKLVILSHFIYTPASLTKAIKIINQCAIGTYVVVRGSAPKSVFQAVSRAYSLRLFTPTSGHAWTISTLQSLIRKSGLCRVDSSKPLLDGMAPDAIVKQSYDLSNGVDPIVDFLGHLYGNMVKDESRDYFQALKKMAGRESLLLPNDDMIFVLVKCAEQV